MVQSKVRSLFQDILKKHRKQRMKMTRCLDLLKVLGKSDPKIFSQIVVKNGDVPFYKEKITYSKNTSMTSINIKKMKKHSRKTRRVVFLCTFCTIIWCRFPHVFWCLKRVLRTSSSPWFHGILHRLPWAPWSQQHRRYHSSGQKKKRVKERFQQSGPLPATSGVMSFHSTYRGYNPCETYLFKRPFIGVY